MCYPGRGYINNNQQVLYFSFCNTQCTSNQIKFPLTANSLINIKAVHVVHYKCVTNINIC